MPLNKSAGIRHRIINNCLLDKKKPFPSLADLAEACSNLIGTDVSESTIEKDIRYMRGEIPNGYDAPIVYDKLRRGYKYNEIGFSIDTLMLKDAEWSALRFASALLYQYRDVPVFSDFKGAIEKINTRFSLALGIEDAITDNFVQFETQAAFNGYDWLQPIFGAIQQSHSLQIAYENIYKNEVKSYDIVPYLLKEHRNRWYVIAWSDARSDYLTFSLDRIVELRVVEKRVKRRSDFDKNRFFANSSGIMESDKKPEKIELEIYYPMARIVELQPLHQSQTMLKKTTASVRLSLFLVPEIEFLHQLTGFGAQLKVLKPASLANAVKKELERALALY